MSEFHTTEDLLENNSIRSLVLKLGIRRCWDSFLIFCIALWIGFL